MLIARIYECEVNDAIWDFDGTKSPSLSDFNFLFYKNNREIVKEDLMLVVKDF